MENVSHQGQAVYDEIPTRAITKESISGGPVTCVSFLSESFCWVARGSFIELTTTTVDPLASVSSPLCNNASRTHLVFPNGGTIHGVQHVGRLSVLFGGRQLAIVCGGRTKDEPIYSATIRSSPSPNTAAAALIVSDWIWDVRVVMAQHHVDEQGRARTCIIVALALANNACEVWMLIERLGQDDVGPLSFTAVRQGRFIGATRSITYSMCFFGWNNGLKHRSSSALVRGDLIVASGTVSNDILIWTAVTETEMVRLETETALAQQHYYRRRSPDQECRLRGHVGVVHAVRFNSTGTLLASASDDRSVRLWWRTQDGDDWTLQWSGWSHKARVWNVAFSSQGVVSCGEDASAKIWCIDDGSLLGEVRVHNCQSIWSIDVFGSLALIGCNDGSAKLCDLERAIIREIDVTAESGEQVCCGTTRAMYMVPDDRPLSELCASSPPVATAASLDTHRRLSSDLFVDRVKKKKKAKVKVKTQTVCGMEFYVDQASCRRLLVSTRAGSLFSLCLDSRTWDTLQPWCDPSLNVTPVDGCCVAVHATGLLAAVGTTKGDVILVSLSLRDKSLCDRPQGASATMRKRLSLSACPFLSIKDIRWLDDVTLIAFHIKGTVSIWELPDISDGVFRGERCNDEPQFVLKTTTMAVPTCCARGSSENTLFVGDSRGNITTFSLLRSNSSDKADIFPTSIAYRVHKKEYVNDILFTPGSGRIISVGNDGCLRNSIFNAAGELETILSLPLSALPGPTRLYVQGFNHETRIGMIVAGYHGNAYLAVDLSSGYELFRIQTGGRQRAHSCFVDLEHTFPASYGMAICVNRADGRNEIALQSCLRQARVAKFNLACLNVKYSIGTPLHGEPVFDLCSFASRPEACYHVLLSGSEDCKARLSIVSRSKIVGSELVSIQSSCIRAVCSSRLPTDSASLLVVCGGKMAIDFYSLVDNNVESSNRSPTSASIMDNMTVHFIGKGYYPFKPSIDPRINAVHAIPIENGGSARHMVVSGDSDGCIYLFDISMRDSIERTISGQLLHDLQRPILTIELIVLPGSSQMCVAAGTTDGSVALWLFTPTDYSSPVSLFGIYEAHQMGTNSISVSCRQRSPSEVLLLICSCGDDQSITTCTVNLAQPSSPGCNIVSFARLDLASPSAVKGVELVDANHVVSVGYNQDLTLWRLASDSGNLRFLSTIAVDVADVNCLCVSPTCTTVAVGGKGIEIFSMSRPIKNEDINIL